VIIVDDVLATGGTALACHDLVDITGAKVAAHLFLLEIEFLQGRKLISETHPDVDVISLLRA
jgi:adenine phosphoribosyltransferase